MIQKEGEHLIFILSLPRSGSTLLGAILGNHSRVSCPPEPWFLLRLADVYGDPCLMKQYDDYYATMATRQFMTEETFIESARAFAVTSYNRHLAAVGKEFFVGKTPRYYHILDFLEKVFPKAIKIWLQRDPLDVASSYKTTWGVTVDQLTGKTIEPHSFDFILGIYALETFFKQTSPYKYVLKYEDLAVDPEGTMSLLCDFCNIPFEEGITSYTENEDALKALRNTELGDKQLLEQKRVHSDSVGKWKKTFSQDEIKQLLGVIGGDVFLRMGYEATIRSATEEFGISDLPTDAELEELRRKFSEICVGGVLFSRDKEYVEKMLEDPGAKFRQVYDEKTVSDMGRRELVEAYTRIKDERDALAQYRDEIHNSLSWRLTAPLRRLGRSFMQK